MTGRSSVAVASAGAGWDGGAKVWTELVGCGGVRLHPTRHGNSNKSEHKSVKIDFASVSLINVIRKPGHHCSPRIEKDPT